MPNPYRLSRSTAPRHYNLRIEPDLTTATFEGVVTIDIDVLESTDVLICNAAELQIHDAIIDGAIATITLDEDHERLTLGSTTELSAGPHRVLIRFTGILNDKLRGFYRSVWTDSDGLEHVIGATQMQATDARRAFPCWDEPDFKATFTITLSIHDGLEAISNSPELTRTNLAGRTVIEFVPTMVMSTYLVAWVVGELEMTEPIDVNGVPLRVVHVPGKAHLTAFGLECGAFGLNWFQQYYGIDYPGAKVDLIAMPDFAAGAMENLGCITCRENMLLVDPDTATQTERQLVADVVLHELAHMWFGDLVTMRWWNGIWLNEAFATFMEIAATDSFRPDWRRWDTFTIERTAAFEVDSLVSTRPVEFEVVSPADADGMFDVLTYQKGGALLRMLEQYLGVDRFRDGIRRYLRTHKYSNTETADLWDALEAETGEPVRKVMDSWIWQGGYPLLTASIRGAQLILDQQRFLFDGAGDDDGRRWFVPVLVRNGDALLQVILDGDRVVVDLSSSDQPVIVNAGAHGFYRVRYSEELLNRIDRTLLATMGPAERYGLVDDAWAAVVAGQLEAPDFVNFVGSFGDETDLATWRIIIAGLTWLDRFVEGPARENQREFTRDLVTPALARLGWEPSQNEDDLSAELRGTLIRTAAVLGNDSQAQQRARAIHYRATAGETIDPAVSTACMSVVAATGRDSELAEFIEKSASSTNPQEALRYLYALAEFPESEQMRRVLELSMSGRVRTQNAPFLLGRCLANRDHGAQAWEFIARNWLAMVNAFPQNTIIRMVDGAKTLTKPGELAAIDGFFSEHPIPQAAKTLEQQRERQRINAQLRARATESLAISSKVTGVE